MRVGAGLTSSSSGGGARASSTSGGGGGGQRGGLRGRVIPWQHKQQGLMMAS